MLIDRLHNVHEQILHTLQCWGCRHSRGTFACRVAAEGELVSCRLARGGELVPVIVVDGEAHDLIQRDTTGANQLFQLGCAEHVPMPEEYDDELREMLKEVDDADWIDVTEWESNFIQSILFARDRPAVLTPAQRAKIRQIYEQYRDKL